MKRPARGISRVSLAQTDALAKLLIEKGIITQREFLAKISEERATYQATLKPTPHKLHQCTALRVETERTVGMVDDFSRCRI
jgi:hypothetical protein